MDRFLEQSLDLNELVLKLLIEKKKDTQRQWIFMLVMCVTMLLSFALFVHSENQAKRELIKQMESTRIDFMEYLDSLEYVIETQTTTTTTQTVEGDNAEINNIEGDQYNDNAVNTGGD